MALDTLGGSVALPTEGSFEGVTYHWDYNGMFNKGMIGIEANGLGLNFGVADHHGKLIIPPLFYGSGPLKYDHVSGYYRAELLQPDGKRLKGFIDGTGRFVMIEVPASKW